MSSDFEFLILETSLYQTFPLHFLTCCILRLWPCFLNGRLIGFVVLIILLLNFSLYFVSAEYLLGYYLLILNNLHYNLRLSASMSVDWTSPLGFTLGLLVIHTMFNTFQPTSNPLLLSVIPIVLVSR